MTPTQRFEEKLAEELYFLSQDGYAVGWRETKKKDILDILLSELSLQKQVLVEKGEKAKIPAQDDEWGINVPRYEIFNNGIDEALALIKKEDPPTQEFDMDIVGH